VRRVSPTIVTIAVFIILVGLVAGFVAKVMLAEKEDQLGPMVFARMNLVEGTQIRADHVAVAQVPLRQIPEGALTSQYQAVGRYVKTTIRSAKEVKDSDLYPIGETPETPSLAEEIPAGYRAVTISVTGANVGPELIKPESVVDIAMTVEEDAPELEGFGRRKGIGTMTLMKGIRVLTNNLPNRGLGAARVRGSQLATIAVVVTPEQANKLILAERYGSLSVTLVSAKDPAGGETVAGEGLVNPRDLTDFTPPPPRPDPPPVLRPKQAVIYRGSHRQVIRFDEEFVTPSADEAPAVEPLPEGGTSPTLSVEEPEDLDLGDQ